MIAVLVVQPVSKGSHSIRGPFLQARASYADPDDDHFVEPEEQQQHMELRKLIMSSLTYLKGMKKITWLPKKKR
jgi:hypothetical protein